MEQYWKVLRITCSRLWIVPFKSKCSPTTNVELKHDHENLLKNVQILKLLVKTDGRTDRQTDPNYLVANTVRC